MLEWNKLVVVVILGFIRSDHLKKKSTRKFKTASAKKTKRIRAQ